MKILSYQFFRIPAIGRIENIAAGEAGNKGLRSNGNQQMLMEERYFCLLIITRVI